MFDAKIKQDITAIMGTMRENSERLEKALEDVKSAKEQFDADVLALVTPKLEEERKALE